MTYANTALKPEFHFEPRPEPQAPAETEVAPFPDLSLKQLKAYARQIRIFRKLIEFIMADALAQHRAALKTAMLSCAVWRGRILRELGGEKALVRWERRYLKSKINLAIASLLPTPLPRNPNLPLRQATFSGFGGRSVDPNTYYDRIKVDMTGRFCLAPIAGSRLRPPRIKTLPYVNEYGLRVKYTDINPITLYPHELRGEGALPRSEPAEPETPERQSAKIIPFPAEYIKRPPPEPISPSHAEPRPVKQKNCATLE